MLDKDESYSDMLYASSKQNPGNYYEISIFQRVLFVLSKIYIFHFAAYF